MLIVESYGLAVVLCVVTMLCWGSWANTQKLASKEWRFQLFYWDYAIGVLLLAFDARTGGPVGRVVAASTLQAIGFWLAVLAVVLAVVSGVAYLRGALPILLGEERRTG